MRIRTILIPTTLLALTLTGCAAPGPSADDGVTVVATTDVYGDIATSIGAGGHVTVTSLIHDAAQDPHEYEATPRDELAIAKAEVVIVNGGGYDPWADRLIASAGHESSGEVITVNDLHAAVAGAEPNEHVWYDLPTVGALAEKLASRFSDLDPANAQTYAANLAAFESALDDLEAREASLAKTAEGTGVAITEPVPLYLLDASGFTNVTPVAFSEAVEEGNDVAPSVLAQVEGLFTSGRAALLVYNEQTESSQTDAVLAAAKSASVPTIGVSETLPAGEHYLSWMGSVLDELQAAVE